MSTGCVPGVQPMIHERKLAFEKKKIEHTEINYGMDGWGGANEPGRRTLAAHQTKAMKSSSH